ncbi:Ltp family lipoprotein [Pseudomonas huaxiensis]|uniref:Ltp family lipoprotein n=1 Tax=Pseudomonas huaxiensis TaxID=2213017 RepID=UPI000DA689B8|nr:Ltp family lipoprotein [Pseudomonas huaxiensis]
MDFVKTVTTAVLFAAMPVWATDLTVPQSNAIRAAASYLESQPFSKKRLIDQLSSPQGADYDVADASFAVNSLKVDWYKQAVLAAKSYLESQGFSRYRLIDQMSSPAGSGFELADAKAAVDSLNVDWNQQAVRSAKSYMESQAFSCKGLIRQLSSSAGSGYTESQATFGAKQAGAC